MALSVASDPSEVWPIVRQMLRVGKQEAQSVRAAAAAAPISAELILRMTTICADVDAELVAAAAVPGIVAYVRNQRDNQSLDVAAEFTGIRTALANVVSEVATLASAVTNGGFLSVINLQASGRYTWRTLSVAQTAGVRTQLDALIASIT